MARDQHCRRGGSQSRAARLSGPTTNASEDARAASFGSPSQIAAPVTGSARAALAALATLAVSACSNPSSFIPNLTGGPSDADRTFLLAAGNWDRNKDGIVTCDEWKAYAAELMDIGDTAKKGYLTKEDWARIVKIDRMFEIIDFGYYDRNGDGKVDRAEFVDRASRAFELADRDKNCQLTTVELTGARAVGTTASQPKITPPSDPSQSPSRGR